MPNLFHHHEKRDVLYTSELDISLLVALLSSELLSLEIFIHVLGSILESKSWPDSRR